MSTLDLLLQLDESKLKKPSRGVEIKRLSELTGERTIFKVEALTPDKMSEIQELCIDYDTERIDMSEFQIMAIIEAVKDPDLKSKKLMEKLNVFTPKDLIKKLLLPGEILSIYNVIGEISGFDGEVVVEEVKN